MRCAAGELACTAVTAPSAEVCDGVDNDCNGKVDDGISCGPSLIGGPFAVSSPKPASSSPPPDATGSCATTPGSAAVGLAVLVALWFGRRRVS
jgi:MYXO-CTERM domain-containing protein